MSNTSVVTLDCASKKAEAVSTTIDAVIFVLWTPQGFVVDVGPTIEGEEYIVCEDEIEAAFYGGEQILY